ncbi:hypothetical protein [Paraburkholderia sp. RAU2J]|uniref:hypothetical protein n=1 Tax=Paraburkholderia sp. RAU2J TaxID=1938810 RepID=UPI0011C46BDF|nr:hypothetical protein [Paraburkholderia sp. RAU2J]
MNKPLMTKDQITQSCLRHVADIGLTKRKDREVAARAWGSLRGLSEFLDDFDLLPLCTQMCGGIRERLSKKGELQFLAWIERRMAEEQRVTKPTVAKRAA